LASRFQEEERPIRVSDLAETLGEGGRKLTELAEISLYVPIHARGKLFALIAIGKRVDQKPFEEVELQVLHASLGMIGVALENTGLYNRLLEKHRQLRMANQTLQELDRLKSEFLRNVNHELRTPLTIIIAYTSFLRDQEREDEQRQEFLDTICKESEKLKELLEKLLDFSAITGDELEIQVETGDIEELVQSFHKDRMPGVAEALHEFTVEVRDRIPLARFDPHRVRQILDILVDNAVKFTPPGSKIQIQMEGVKRDGRVWVQIDVVDDGPGIPEDHLPGLFDSFRQVDGSSTRTVGGLGMGLAFARTMAENMGGGLEVRSEIGSGTSFTLFLPTV
jgi:signal transduction histidine kinase